MSEYLVIGQWKLGEFPVGQAQDLQNFSARGMKNEAFRTMLRSVGDQKEDIPRSWPSFGRMSIIRIFSQKCQRFLFQKRQVRSRMPNSCLLDCIWASLMCVLKHKSFYLHIKSSKWNAQPGANLELNSPGMFCPLADASVISSFQMESPQYFTDRKTTPEENGLS